VYDELPPAGEALMKREAPGHTVQATMLVHDAYLKLIRQDRASWSDRNHFFAVAAQTMRRLLVDHARGRGRDKRGGGRSRCRSTRGSACRGAPTPTCSRSTRR